jgi:pyrimidine-specific ribonucleoside hydrolase
MTGSARGLRVCGLLAALVALVLAASPAHATSSSKVPVVVDTDLGNDDIVALSFLAARRDVDLLAVTVSGTGLATCPGAAYRAARILRALGRPRVPVACGRDTPLEGFNAFPVEWREAAAKVGASLPPSRAAVSKLRAPELLAETIAGASASVTLLTLGPLTNVAEMLRAHPSVRSRIARVVAMAGAVRVPGNIGPGHERAEYNVWVDPRAAREVVASGIPAALVPLDATNGVPVEGLLVHEIARRGGAPARVASLGLEGQPGMFQTFYWDPLAAATIVDPRVVRWERMRLSVLVTGDARNGTLRQGSGGAPLTVAVAARRPRFEQLLLRTLARDPGARIRLPKPAFTVSLASGACSVEAHTSRSGPGWVRLRNRTNRDALAVLLALRADKTLDDLRTAIRNRAPNEGPPAWVTIAAFVPATARSDGWGEFRASPGLHAVACFDALGTGRVAPTSIVLR